MGCNDFPGSNRNLDPVPFEDCVAAAVERAGADSEAVDLPQLRVTIEKATAEGVFESREAEIERLAAEVKARAVAVGREAIYAADVADPRSTAEIVVDALIARGLITPRPLLAGQLDAVRELCDNSFSVVLRSGSAADVIRADEVRAALGTDLRAIRVETVTPHAVEVSAYELPPPCGCGLRVSHRATERCR